MIGQGFLTKLKNIFFSPNRVDTSTMIATCDNITIE